MSFINYTKGDSDVILFHIYASWFLPPSYGLNFEKMFLTVIALKYALFDHMDKGLDPTCFCGYAPTNIFRSWVRIGIGPTHFLKWIVYYCVCIQHDIDKSQISFIELWFHFISMVIRTCIELLLLTKACFSKHCFVTAEFKIFILPADCGVWTHPHFYTYGHFLKLSDSILFEQHDNLRHLA